MIVPVLTVVGDSDAEIARARDRARMSLAFYGSTPNYAFIWDEAGFEGTTARVREKQKAGDFAGMAAEITDDHVAAFATEATWDTLADALVDKYGHIVDRLVLYSAADESPERFTRYGEVARRIVARPPPDSLPKFFRVGAPSARSAQNFGGCSGAPSTRSR